MRYKNNNNSNIINSFPNFLMSGELGGEGGGIYRFVTFRVQNLVLFRFLNMI